MPLSQRVGRDVGVIANPPPSRDTVMDLVAIVYWILALRFIGNTPAV